jgi:signal transduction histidine kinase
VLAIGIAVPVAIRRRAPVRALVVVLAACLVTIGVGGEITRGPFLAVALVLYLVASTCRRTVALAGLAASLALLVPQGVALHFNGRGSGNATGAGMVLIIFWTVGYAVQQRRNYMAHVRDRAASDAVTRERLRIARELHDVVAHSMTVVTVQAGFGEYVFDSQPGEARAALGAIQMVSREALGELQRLLCVLRQTDAEAVPARLAPQAEASPDWTGRPDDPAAERDRPQAPLAPAPGLAGLERLVQRTAGAGVQVTVERTGTVHGVPAGIDLSAFRIVQEALTNVVKHSGADNCHVLIDYGVRDLIVEITDHGPGAVAELSVPARAPAGVGVPARAPAGANATTGAAASVGVNAGASARRSALARSVPRAGHGIIGMRERVSLCGGELSAGPLPAGGFQVRARLPVAGGRP